MEAEKEEILKIFTLLHKKDIDIISIEGLKLQF